MEKAVQGGEAMAEQDKEKQPDRGRANRTILRRTIFLMALCGVVMFLPLIHTLWQLCVVDHDYYEELAVRQQTKDVTVSAMRGKILDANGNVLAMSATVYNLILSPRDVVASVSEADYKGEDGTVNEALYQAAVAAKKAEIVDGICQVLPQLDREDVQARMDKDSAYQILIKSLETADATAVREYISAQKLSSCLYLTPSSKRYYPYSSLAAQVIGFVNDNGGAYGIEALYDDTLSGTVGRVVYAKAGNSTQLPDSYSTYVDASDGSNVTLTIDTTIQYYAEQAVQEGIEKFGVLDGGFAIVMDPNTGAILAHVSLPDYDLNDPATVIDSSKAAVLEQLKANAATDEGEQAYEEALAEARFEQWRSKVVNETYEPGSTFKSLVLAAALEEGAVSESDTFYCPGYYVVNGTRIGCWKAGGHGTQTLAKAVENSCNPAFMQIGQKLGAEKFYEYFSAYGMKEITGVDLLGEQVGVSWDEDYFTSLEGYLSLATASFGQRFTVTPIRLITAVAATINGGKLYQPYVVDHISDSDGNLISQTTPTVIRQVVSEQVSQTVASILEGVVANGTGSNAYVAGYRVGGKTGTSETLNENEYIVSFIGFAPADDPKVIVLLGLKNPEWAYGMYSTSGYYISGGQMAAPLVGKIISQTLEYMGVEKEYTETEANGKDVSVPKVEDYTLNDAIQLLEDKGLSYRTVGSGSVVTGQIPAVGSSIPSGSQVILYLDSAVPTDQVEVPNVTGMTYDRAKETLAAQGLYMKATGVSTYYTASTLATGQSVDPGVLVDRGQVIEVRFANNDIYD
jgi:stage V sporulation protein D (sporulation-specific penicillin-binding protein)